MGKSSKAVIQSAFHSSGKLLFSQKTEFLKHRGMIERKKEPGLNLDQIILYRIIQEKALNNRRYHSEFDDIRRALWIIKGPC